MIKGVLLDYGGTIDTNGLHWANVLWDSYRNNQVHVPEEAFAAAYKFGERALAINPIIRPHHVFGDVLKLKVEQQFVSLRDQGFDPDPDLIGLVAAECEQFARTTVEKAAGTLAKLAEQYPLVMVSNFYGNIQAVLEDFGIAGYFQSIVESAVVGFRKPEPQIYQLGVDRLGFSPAECVVVGDSYSKDVVPARTVGCRTIWLNVKGWEEQHAAGTDADAEITDFAQTPDVVSRLG
ncbi:HAD family hydrolase [Dyadobacter sandarakinus]|uniref:HAD family hydrolase n=1 Tax=Dyadobacter sandarakinus TaxID=2747268 RepID=A0ABX7IDL6_9BACT|nr:HAD family hydrolase [Dyadobacter sandarakinus]QRR03895.1 HAD family hydrolase [Dyadobacter sandarakinus]